MSEAVTTNSYARPDSEQHAGILQGSVCFIMAATALGSGMAPGLPSRIPWESSDHETHRPSSLPLVGFPQGLDVDLAHLKHRLHDPLGFLRVGVPQEFRQGSRNDLPRHTVLILQPAALPFFSTLGELFPQLIHFLLCLAVHIERDGLGELELRTTVQGYKRHACDLERHNHGGPFRAWPRLAVSLNLHDSRILEDGGVSSRRLFGLSIKP